jgi:hypothetical protein
MARGRAPVWLQLLIVWVVLSGLGASALMFMRSRNVFGDAVFQPLAPILCAPGGRIETTYGSRASTVDAKGRSAPSGGRQLVSTGLDDAVCVSPDGRRVPVKGGLTALVLALGAVGGAVVTGTLALARRRRRRARGDTAGAPGR